MSKDTFFTSMLGDNKLTFEEFYTLLTEIEACLNSRPITEISNDPCDMSALTPGHFLIGGPLTSIAEPRLVDENIGLLNRWKMLTKITQQFWKRWSSEFLARLQERSKWIFKEKNITIGELLLIKNESISPLRWPLGRVIELHTGKDGKVRVVTLRTVGGLIKRNIHNLCLLPINFEMTSQGGEYVGELDMNQGSYVNG